MHICSAKGEGNCLPCFVCTQTNNVGKDEPAGLGGKESLHYALELAKEGFVTLAPDYPSFGEYKYDFASDDRYISGTLSKRLYDSSRGARSADLAGFVNAKQIGCIGHSLGGHNTIFTMVHDERIQAGVSCCGFTRFHKYYEGKLKGWTSARYMPKINDVYDNNPDKVPFDFPELLACLAPRAF
ncbi:MAG: prolyl oligopeptidase family serine peptidase [Pirellulales bacterium]